MTIIQSIKISQALAGTAVSGTIYTCAANSYALVQVHNGGAANGLVSIAGAGVATVSFAANTVGAQDWVQLYVGPGQVVSVANVGGATWSITGVEFINS